MSDLLGRTYDESYPPSIWLGPPVVPSTGATAGTPGTWTPTGSTPPANAAAATGVVASPATDWTVGQYVQGSTAGTGGEMNWNGTAWVAGRSAVAGTAGATPEVEAPEAQGGGGVDYRTDEPPSTPTRRRRPR